MVKECSVYLIGSETGHLKIGIGNNPYKRKKQLQTGHPEKLEVFYSIQVESREEALRIEKESHRALSRYRLEGEWFDIDVSLGKKIIDDAANPELRIKLNNEKKQNRINELEKLLSRNSEETKILSSEMSKTKKYLDEIHEVWMNNLKEYSNILDELRMLGVDR